MIEPILSILVPTIVGRENEFSKLQAKIHEHIRYYTEYLSFKPINFIFAIDNKEMTIGEKREWLYANASGKYSWQIDDDDDISDEAIGEIIKATLNSPDCITFQEACNINGQYFSSNHSLTYEDWGEKQDGFDYVRTPFMKSVIKTEIARSVPIPHIRFGEDHEWAKALKPHLQTEIHIDKELYYYQHTSTPHNERYGIK